MTLRDYFEDGDAYILRQIKEEYHYLIEVLFDLEALRDTLKEDYKSITDISRQISECRTRAKYIDDCRNTICLPTVTRFMHTDGYTLRKSNNNANNIRKTV